MQVKGVPIQGQWELTFRCNLKCLHCYVVEDKTKEELTFQEITNILDQLHNEGCLWLCLTGGEPLIRSDFLDIYTYAKHKGFLITIFTNGTLITPEIADYLTEYPPFMIDITLNGITAETYESITQVPGSFQSCMQGINLIMEKELPLTLKSNGMTLNRGEILKIKEWVDGLGKVKYRYDSILIPKLDGSKEPCQFRLSSKEIMDIEYSDNNMRQEWKECLQADHELYEPDNLFRCGGGVSLFNISPYGELQLCHLLRSPSFNLRQGPFKEGFYQLFPRIRSAKYQTNSKCRDCQIWYLCAQCPARAKLENGDPQIPVNYFCELAHRRNQMKAILVD
ncbi:MAG: radical SAM protein [bacterium]|nr:radical SAM protein [bacterium]